MQSATPGSARAHAREKKLHFTVPRPRNTGYLISRTSLTH